MARHVNVGDVPTVGYDAGGDADLETKMVYGRKASMVHAVRPDGYHSDPHVHPAEQLNFVLEGSVWLFVGEEAVLLEPGDFHRVPGLAVHWAKVEDGPCTLVEAHAPAYVGDEAPVGPDRERAVGLFADDETETVEDPSTSVRAAQSYADDEAAMMARYREREDG